MVSRLIKRKLCSFLRSTDYWKRFYWWNTTTVDEEVTGINASYTMGAASIRLLNSVSDNDGFTANTEKEHTEISVVLSF